MSSYSPIFLGDAKENPTRLDAMDVMGDVAWSQMMVANAMLSHGEWSVSVVEAGTYKITLKRWPREYEKNLQDSMTLFEKTSLAPYHEPIDNPINITKAMLSIGSTKLEMDVSDGNEIEFTCHLIAIENTTLCGKFLLDDGRTIGAYYVYVYRLESSS
jgi:hypothetical protein